MQNFPRCLSPLLLGLALGSVYCDDDYFTKLCRSLCQGHNCADGVDVEACTDEHVERKDEAAEVSVDCQDRYVTMIECAAIRGCSELANWEELRGLDFDYPCRDETEKFLVVCPDLWFEKK